MSAAFPDPALPVSTLTAAVRRRLRDDILAGRLAPGQRLKLGALTLAYGTGASPVREALSHLASEGLAERLDRRGFRVAAADVAELEGLIHARCLAEGAALRDAIARGDAAWEERVLVAEHRLSRVGKSGPGGAMPLNPEWEVLHGAFHRALLSGSPAGPLLEFCDGLHERAGRYRAISDLAHPERDTAGEHAAIARATLDRDADRAADLLSAHYRRTADLIRDALQRAPRAAAARESAGKRA